MGKIRSWFPPVVILLFTMGLKIINFLGDIDFVVERSKNLGWLAIVINFLMNPIFHFLLIVIGLGWFSIVLKKQKTKLPLKSEGENDLGEDSKSELEIIDSFPKDNVPISRNEIKNFFLKFNKPIDFDTTSYIVNFHVKANSVRQWNGCGWIEMAEEDTKLIWHVEEHLLQEDKYYGPQAEGVNYHTFEIQVGRPPKEWRLCAKDGDKLPLTTIRVRIKPEK